MPYGPILMAALLFEYAMLMLGDALNLRALREGLPAQFARVYDATRYNRVRTYTREVTRFSWIPRTFDLGVLLAFWFYGGFEWLDAVVGSLGRGPILTGMMYIGALALAQEIISLPFRWYSTFKIEGRFGFNTTTPATFALDELKGVLLAVALGGPLLAAVLWFFGATGNLAWLWCFGVTAGVLVGVHFVAPSWFLPLFNDFRPLENGELKQAVLDYSRRVGFPLEGLFVVDGSKRSTKANAFLTGFGSRKRVALFDTLIQQQTTDEMVAIVAHEIGHVKKRHLLRGVAFEIAQLGVVFFLLSIFLGDARVFAAFQVSRPSIYVGLVLFGIAYAPIGLVLSLLVQASSRQDELEADAFARVTTGSGEALATALEKLSAESLANPTPHPFYVTLHHAHPPLAERVAALRAYNSETTASRMRC